MSERIAKLHRRFLQRYVKGPSRILARRTVLAGEREGSHRERGALHAMMRRFILQNGVQP